MRRWLPLLLVACQAAEPMASPSAPPQRLPAPPVAATGSALAGPPGLIFDPEIMRGTYPIEVLSRALDKQVDRMRACATGSAGSGKVVVRFVLARDGAVAAVQDDGSDFPDEHVVQCVLHVVMTLQFRPPEDGVVIVRYRLELGRAP